MNIEDLKKELESLKNVETSYIKEARDTTLEYIDKLNSIIKSELGEIWSIRSLNKDTMSMGFVCGTYKGGSPKYEILEVYHGFDYFLFTENPKEHFRFDITNPSFGAFSIDEDSSIKTYFLGFGKFLSNAEFANTIRNILYEYDCKIYDIDEKRYGLLTEKINKVSAEINEMENEKEFNELKNRLKNNKFAIVAKTYSPFNILYRNAKVKVLECGNDEPELSRKAYINYQPRFEYVRVVKVSSLKF